MISQISHILLSRSDGSSRAWFTAKPRAPGPVHGETSSPRPSSIYRGRTLIETHPGRNSWVLCPAAAPTSLFPVPGRSGSFRFAPFSVLRNFRFVSFREIPCRKFSVSFRFACCRVACFPFRSVSWCGVSRISRFVAFRSVPCPDGTVSLRFVVSVSHRFV